MSLPGTLQGGRENRRIEEQLHKALLVFEGQANQLGFIDGLECDLLSRGDHKIADAAALQFRGALDDSERIGRNASFDARRAGCLPRHGRKSPASIVREFTSQKQTGFAQSSAANWRHSLPCDCATPRCVTKPLWVFTPSRMA